jgi:polyhydroxyalkanoate synthesis repressor PhaR
MPVERVIKKYANRRLYDAAASRHVTLEDLRKLIVQGEKIRVVDDKTGDDLTRSILLQIIADQEQFGQPILSTATLESIIRFYGDAMQGFMGRFLEQSVASFVGQQQALQSQLSKIMSGTPLGSMAELAQNNLAAWQQVQENLAAAFRPRQGGSESRGAGAAGAPSPEAPPASAADGRSSSGDADGSAPGGRSGPRRGRKPRASRD